MLDERLSRTPLQSSSERKSVTVFQRERAGAEQGPGTQRVAIGGPAPCSAPGGTGHGWLWQVRPSTYKAPSGSVHAAAAPAPQAGPVPRAGSTAWGGRTPEWHHSGWGAAGKGLMWAPVCWGRVLQPLTKNSNEWKK